MNPSLVMTALNVATEFSDDSIFFSVFISIDKFISNTTLGDVVGLDEKFSFIDLPNVAPQSNIILNQI